jgi:hypothetical protein
MKKQRSHAYFKELLLLSFYDEIHEAEKEEIRSHLDECKICRQEQKDLMHMRHQLAEAKAPTVSDEFLKEARALLPPLQQKHSPADDILQRFLQWVAGLMTPRAQLAWASLLFLCVGFGAGYLYVQRAASTPDGIVQTGATRTENIKVISADPVSGEIELSGERILTVRVKGKIDDERVVALMAKSLTDDRNPGVRLRAVSLISRQGDDHALASPIIKKALMAAVTGDENPAVRKEALLALSGFPFDQEIQSALLSVLAHDENAGIRIAAIDALQLTKYEDRLKDRNIQSALRSSSTNDKNMYVRQQAQLLIQEAVNL